MGERERGGGREGGREREREEEEGGSSRFGGTINKWREKEGREREEK